MGGLAMPGHCLFLQCKKEKGPPAKGEKAGDPNTVASATVPAQGGGAGDDSSPSVNSDGWRSKKFKFIFESQDHDYTRCISGHAHAPHAP